MDRIFAFGCSFTSYVWPTWADILIKDFKDNGKQGYNFGQSGSGNLFIFIKLMEAIKKYEINENDLVLICWTSLQREDRFVNGNWVTPGSIYSQKIYNDKFIEKWCDIEHFVYRDCALMLGAKLALTNIGCKYVNFSMSKLKQMDSAKVESLFKETNDVIDFYGSSIETDLIPMMEYLDLVDRTPSAFERRKIKTYWGNINEVNVEWHPTPSEHLKYLKSNILPFINMSLSDATYDYVKNWGSVLNSFQSPINLHQIQEIRIQNDKTNSFPENLLNKKEGLNKLI